MPLNLNSNIYVLLNQISFFFYNISMLRASSTGYRELLIKKMKNSINNVSEEQFILGWPVTRLTAESFSFRIEQENLLKTV